MDVLYSVKCVDDGWDLRMSLRSLERNGRNLGRVVVAGGPFPAWLANAVEVRCDSPYPRKQKNILHAIVEAMSRGAVSGPCLYSSDDHFMLKPYDLDRFPWFCRTGINAVLPDETWYRERGWPLNNFRRSIIATRRLLETAGLPVDQVGGHMNTHLDTRDLDAVLRLAKGWEESPWGYEPSTLFIACARARDPSVRFTPRHDVKLRGPHGAAQLDRMAAEGDGLLSCADSAACGDFRAWMEARFPEPSRWERA